MIPATAPGESARDFATGHAFFSASQAPPPHVHRYSFVGSWRPPAPQETHISVLASKNWEESHAQPRPAENCRFPGQTQPLKSADGYEPSGQAVHFHVLESRYAKPLHPHVFVLGT